MSIGPCLRLGDAKFSNTCGSSMAWYELTSVLLEADILSSLAADLELLSVEKHWSFYNNQIFAPQTLSTNIVFLPPIKHGYWSNAGLTVQSPWLKILSSACRTDRLFKILAKNGKNIGKDWKCSMDVALTIQWTLNEHHWTLNGQFWSGDARIWPWEK